MRILLLSFTLLIWVGCSGDSSQPSAPVLTAIFISSPSSEVLLGHSKTSLQLSAMGLDQYGDRFEGIEFEWSTDNASIGTIDQKGNVEIVSVGNVTFSAASNGIVGTIQIDVSEVFRAGRTVFKYVNVVDVANGLIIEEQDVFVEDDQIVLIKPASTNIPENTTVINGSGKYLAPGLTDAHVHVVLETDFIKYLYNGITSVIDMGFPSSSRTPPPVLEWKRSILEGTLAGPNYYPAIMIRGPQDNGRVVVSSASEAREAVRFYKDYDFIKAYSFVPATAFNALVNEGSIYDLSVIGHANRNMGLQSILQNGQVMIAHAEEFLYSHYTGIQPEKTQSAIDFVLNAEAYVTATLSTYEAISLVWGQNQSGYDQLIQRNGYQYLDQLYKNTWENQFLNAFNQAGSLTANLDFQREFIQAFNDAGIPLLFGTDSPGIVGQHAGFSIQEEIRNLQQAGISNTDILKIGSANFGAFVKEYTRYDEDFGQVKEGFRADLVLLISNPFDNLATFRNPAIVMVRGKVYTREFLSEQLKLLKN